MVLSRRRTQRVPAAAVVTAPRALAAGRPRLALASPRLQPRPAQGLVTLAAVTGWTLVQKGTENAVTGGTTTPALPGASAAGTLLVACLGSRTNVSFTGPAGWVQGPVIQAATTARAEIWYYQNNPGGITSAAFTSGTVQVRGVLSEYQSDAGSGVIVESTGTGTASANTVLTVTATAASTAGDLAVCAFEFHYAGAQAITWTDPAGFTLIASEGGSGSDHPYSAYQLSTASGTLAVTGTASVSATNLAGVVATFRAVTYVPPVLQQGPPGIRTARAAPRPPRTAQQALVPVILAPVQPAYSASRPRPAGAGTVRSRAAQLQVTPRVSGPVPVLRGRQLLASWAEIFRRRRHQAFLRLAVSGPVLPPGRPPARRQAVQQSRRPGAQLVPAAAAPAPPATRQRPPSPRRAWAWLRSRQQPQLRIVPPVAAPAPVLRSQRLRTVQLAALSRVRGLARALQVPAQPGRQRAQAALARKMQPERPLAVQAPVLPVLRVAATRLRQASVIMRRRAQALPPVAPVLSQPARPRPQPAVLKTRTAQRAAPVFPAVVPRAGLPARARLLGFRHKRQAQRSLQAPPPPVPVITQAIPAKARWLAYRFRRQPQRQITGAAPPVPVPLRQQPARAFPAGLRLRRRAVLPQQPQAPVSLPRQRVPSAVMRLRGAAARLAAVNPVTPVPAVRRARAGPQRRSQPQRVAAAAAPAPPARALPASRRLAAQARRGRAWQMAGKPPVLLPPQLPRPPQGSRSRLAAIRRAVTRISVFLQRVFPPSGTTWRTAAPAPLRWQARPLPARWRLSGASCRWTITAAEPRWEAAAASPRWRILMAVFDPVAAVSKEEVNVSWTADLAGTSVDPTGQTQGQPLLPVQFSFPVSSGDLLRPAQAVTWYAGTWLTGTTSRGYIAQCLVGSGGGVVTLTAGTVYDVWCQVLGTPESPAKFAGQLTVY